MMPRHAYDYVVAITPLCQPCRYACRHADTLIYAPLFHDAVASDDVMRR